eukprot:3956946-Alexandrium_andersonii.AAC.1
MPRFRIHAVHLKQTEGCCLVLSGSRKRLPGKRPACMAPARSPKPLQGLRRPLLWISHGN